ncbi:hypothetical protein BH20ACT21_BH20ACT21_00030 [soil metagenome]
MSTTTQASETLSSYLSKRVRALRVERGWRQEDVAARARAAGLNWQWDNVSGIEHGTRFLSVEELFVLPGLFDLTLPELLSDGDEHHLLELGDECAATLLQLRQSFRGEWTLPVRAGHRDSVPGIAERKAARKMSKALGFDVAPATIMRLSQDLWGRSLSAERDVRISETADLQDDWNRSAALLGLKETTPRSLQAIRGHMTRELLDELKPEIEKVRQRSRRAMQKEKKR